MKKVLNKNSCSMETKGTIKQVCLGRDAKRLTVEYHVENIPYILKENIEPISITKRIGFIPIGKENKWNVNGNIGESITVKYNPSNPKRAFIKNNKEK